MTSGVQRAWSGDSSRATVASSHEEEASYVLLSQRPHHSISRAKGGGGFIPSTRGEREHPLVFRGYSSIQHIRGFIIFYDVREFAL